MIAPDKADFSPHTAVKDTQAYITPTKLKEMLRASQINVTDEINTPPVCIEILNNNDACVLGTLGNISLIIGKAKQGKTFVISMVLAAAEINNSFSNTIKVSLPAHQQSILYFDTEQSKFHVQKVLKRICSMVGVKLPNNLHVFGLRKYTPNERLLMIEYAISKSKNVGLVVIDGIRDLITSINDEEQSSNITSKLLKWSEEKNIHIMTVLHMNKNDGNARGHIGSELTNKSETVLSVIKSENIKEAVVSGEYTRDKSFEPFAFSIDEEGIPYIIHGWSDNRVSAKSQKKPLLPGVIPKETHIEFLRKIIKTGTGLKWKELRLSLSNEINSWYGYKVSMITVESYIQYYLDNKILVKTGSKPHTQYILAESLNNNKSY